MEKKLEVRNLKISFRTQGGILQAVRNISFDLYKGETLAIVGESGSGKSVTNRTIMGILAGNGFVESGEIIYDGMDLVQISEDEFHKIRGDMIAMIFQDPMSSLNPIMKIGKQLTEAMLLKNRAARNKAKGLFNSKLALLNKNLDAVAEGDSEAIARNKITCKTFDEFCVNSTKLEKAYNSIRNEAEELKVDIDDFVFLVEKKQNVDAKSTMKDFLKRIARTVHPRVVVDDERLHTLKEQLSADLAAVSRSNVPQETVDHLKELSGLLNEAINKEKPNFFCLGYYMMKNPEANLDGMDLKEMNEMVRNYIDSEFMDQFIADGTKAIQHSHDEAQAKKKANLEMLREAREYFASGNLNEKEAKAYAKKLGDEVTGAIDNLEVIKDATEYTFHSSIKKMVDKYFDGIRQNDSETKRYAKQKAKYDALVAKGKTPEWKPADPVIFDEQLGLNNISSLISNLIADYEEEKPFDSRAKMVSLIDYFKEQASALVSKVTKKTAKARALKLLEEVGIPEPTIRYNQYPFELSGGMRQRIVIAIALAANPDILICDEPTTALDVTIQGQILELINRIKKERNLSVIFITHNLGVVANMADRIAVMYAGKIVEMGTAEEVFYDPRHPYTWALLSSMPDLETKDKLEAIPGTPPNMIYPPKGDAFAERNKYALEIDFEQEPPMFDITETHKAATWLLHPKAPKIEKPKIITERIKRMREREAARNGK